MEGREGYGCGRERRNEGRRPKSLQAAESWSQTARNASVGGIDFIDGHCNNLEYIWASILKKKDLEVIKCCALDTPVAASVVNLQWLCGRDCHTGYGAIGL